MDLIGYDLMCERISNKGLAYIPYIYDLRLLDQ